MGLFSALVGTPARTRLIKELTKHRIVTIPDLDPSTRRDLLKIAESMTVVEAMSLPEANLCVMVETYADLRRKSVEHSKALLMLEAHRGSHSSAQSVSEMDLVDYLAYRLMVECKPTAGANADWFAHTVSELAAHYRVTLEPPKNTRSLTPFVQHEKPEEPPRIQAVPPSGPLVRYVFNCPKCARALQAELPPDGRSVKCYQTQAVPLNRPCTLHFLFVCQSQQHVRVTGLIKSTPARKVLTAQFM
jgi:hypothetical protein